MGTGLGIGQGVVMMDYIIAAGGRHRLQLVVR